MLGGTEQYIPPECVATKPGEHDVGRSLLSLFSARGRYIVVLTAFLDESGTNPETPVLSVGGFYGSNDQWQAFRQSWEPLSKGFHAKNSSRMFRDLCSAIEHSKVSGVLLTIDKDTYKACASAHLKTAVGNPYSVCAFLCAIQICAQVNVPVSVVLEQGQPNLGFVKSILEDMMDSGEWSIATVASAKKTDFIELHTADFLSHIASSHDTAWMQRLFDQGRHKYGHVTEEMLRETSTKVTDCLGLPKLHARKQRKPDDNYSRRQDENEDVFKI